MRMMQFFGRGVLVMQDHEMCEITRGVHCMRAAGATRFWRPVCLVGVSSIHVSWCPAEEDVIQHTACCATATLTLCPVRQGSI